MVTLTVFQTRTYLPNPETADVQARVLTNTIHRSIGGNRRFTYVKSGGQQILTYVFRLTRAKAIELSEFIAAYHATEIAMTNHKNEVWTVKFERNPFEFIQPIPDTSEITLTFVGELAV